MSEEAEIAKCRRLSKIKVELNCVTKILHSSQAEEEGSGVMQSERD
jgi:hypothetical protein